MKKLEATVQIRRQLERAIVRQGLHGKVISHKEGEMPLESLGKIPERQMVLVDLGDWTKGAGVEGYVLGHIIKVDEEGIYLGSGGMGDIQGTGLQYFDHQSGSSRLKEYAFSNVGRGAIPLRGVLKVTVFRGKEAKEAGRLAFSLDYSQLY